MATITAYFPTDGKDAAGLGPIAHDRLSPPTGTPIVAHRLMDGTQKDRDMSLTDEGAPDHAADPARELEYRLRQQALAAEFGIFAFKTHDVESLLQEATRVVAEGLQTRFAKIMEHDRERGVFIVRAGVGWKPGVIGSILGDDALDNPAGYALFTGKPVTSNHLDQDSRFKTPDILVEHGVNRAINVIIRGEREPFGVLEVDSPDEGRFDAADTAFLQGFANLLGVVLERQVAEDSLVEGQRLLRQAIDRQHVLTREISHRVKNSLAIVAGLLNMQSRTTDDSRMRQALADAHARVQTIAKVHDQLWRHDDIHSIDLATFLGDLCDSFRQTSPTYVIVCDVEAVSIATDQAVSLGLLVNELVTNACKYAYPDRRGEVRIDVRAIGDDRLRLEVRDFGVGLPQSFDAGASSSLGWRLVDTLGRQLGGEPEWRDGQPGTLFRLDIRRRAGMDTG
jgi:two-component sensor histidine kinase